MERPLLHSSRNALIYVRMALPDPACHVVLDSIEGMDRSAPNSRHSLPQVRLRSSRHARPMPGMWNGAIRKNQESGLSHIDRDRFLPDLWLMIGNILG